MNETRSLALLARIIGRRNGIEVVFSPDADTASTDGKRITLPIVANIGTDDHAILIAGLVDHEAMHCRFTAFDALLGRREPIVASLANLLEDVWGEREQAKIYPGCAQNIRRSMDVMIRLGWYRGPLAGVQEPPALLLTNYLVNALLARLYAAPALQQFADEYRALLAASIGEDLVARLWTTACRVDQVASTAAAVALAKEIIDLLKQTQQQSKKSNRRRQKSKDPTGAKSGAPASGPGSDQAGQPTEATREDGRSDADQQATIDLKQGQHAKSEHAIRQILDASEDQLARGDMSDRLLAALSGEGKTGSKAAGDLRQAACTAWLGDVAGSTPRYSIAKAGPADSCSYKRYHDAAIDLSRSIEIKLGTRMAALLEAKTDCFVLHKRTGRRFESRRAPRLAVGKLDVFRAVEEGSEVDTSVYFLIDCSMSMFNNFAGTGCTTAQVPEDETRVAAAAGVAYAAAQVLDKHDIPFGMACFGTKHRTVKSFGDRWAVARRLGMTEALGGTMTHCAVMHMAEELVLRHETRKLAILVTDGEPEDYGAAIAAINESRRMAIEFAALFVGAHGAVFERMLKAQGHEVSRAMTRESLAASFFGAVQRSF